jgi:DNA adenine methylase
MLNLNLPIPQYDATKEQRLVRMSGAVPSLIKWTGSKRSQAAAIVGLMPSYKRYFEPFVGGGAVLYAAASPSSIASDDYRPLIELWQLVQRSPRTVIETYREQWQAVTDELDNLDLKNLPANTSLPTYFYQVRDRFNREKSPLDLNFIMRTCVNGIVRFNDKGAFNNSFHLSRRGMTPDRFEKVVSAWHSIIQDVEFICQDYAEALERTRAGDFVYMDPPYAGNNQRYTADLELDRFFKELENLNRKDVKWALSFDGTRGQHTLIHDVPKSLYKRHKMLSSGLSAVHKVLNGPVEAVEESLYLNY